MSGAFQQALCVSARGLACELRCAALRGISAIGAGEKSIFFFSPKRVFSRKVEIRAFKCEEALSARRRDD